MGFYYYLMRLLLVFVGFFFFSLFFFKCILLPTLFSSDSQETNDPQHRPLALGTREMEAVLLMGRGGLQTKPQES